MGNCRWRARLTLTGGDPIMMTPSVEGNMAFYTFYEDLQCSPIDEKPTCAPDDRRLIGLAVAVKVARAPIVSRLVRSEILS